MKDRIEELISALQISQGEFADTLQIQRSGLSHLLSGRNKPSYDFMEKLIESYPSINLNWFITGKGNMFINQNSSPTLFQEEESAVYTTKSIQKPENIHIHSEKIIILNSDGSAKMYVLS